MSVGLSSPIESIIHREPLVVPPQWGRDMVLQLMQANRVHQLPVVDEQRRVVGLHLWDDLLASKVMQVLATEGATQRSSGELPWRTSFGTPLQLLRHQRNDVALAELARVYVRDALRRWAAEAKGVAVKVARDDSTLALRIRFSAADGSSSTVTVPLVSG